MVRLAITRVQTLLIQTHTYYLATYQLSHCLGLDDLISKNSLTIVCWCKKRVSSYAQTLVLQSLVISISGNAAGLREFIQRSGLALRRTGSIHARVCVTCPFLLCVCVCVSGREIGHHSIK